MAIAIPRLRQRLVFIGIVTAVLFVAFAATRVTYRRFETLRELGAVESEIEQLQAEKESLTERIASFEEIATIERAAREVLNLQREGESVVILLPSGEEIVIEEEEPAPGDAKELSNPVKWWGYFFGDAEEQL